LSKDSIPQLENLSDTKLNEFQQFDVWCHEVLNYSMQRSLSLSDHTIITTNTTTINKQINKQQQQQQQQKQKQKQQQKQKHKQI
jgi:hypothetical protein